MRESGWANHAWQIMLEKLGLHMADLGSFLKQGYVLTACVTGLETNFSA